MVNHMPLVEYWELSEVGTGEVVGSQNWKSCISVRSGIKKPWTCIFLGGSRTIIMTILHQFYQSINLIADLPFGIRRMAGIFRGPGLSYRLWLCRKIHWLVDIYYIFCMYIYI